MPTENPWKDPSKIWAWSSYRPFVVKEVYSSTVSTLANFPSKRIRPAAQPATLLGALASIAEVDRRSPSGV